MAEAFAQSAVDHREGGELAVVDGEVDAAVVGGAVVRSRLEEAVDAARGARAALCGGADGEGGVDGGEEARRGGDDAAVVGEGEGVGLQSRLCACGAGGCEEWSHR